MKFNEIAKRKIAITMSSAEVKEVLASLKAWIRTQDDNVSDRVLAVLEETLQYAETNLTRPFSIAAPERYVSVNFIFERSLNTAKSVWNEKQFYISTRTHLDSIKEVSSKLRQNVLPVIVQQEAAFKLCLEKSDQRFIDARKGYVNSAIAFGFILTVANRNPIYMLLALIALVPDIIHSDLNGQPSLWGRSFYENDNLVEMGIKLHGTIGRVNIGDRSLTLFGYTANAAVGAVEGTVTRSVAMAERLQGRESRVEELADGAADAVRSALTPS